MTLPIIDVAALVAGPGDDPAAAALAAAQFDLDTYGDYLLSKVGRVFPQLRAEVL